jgi:pilus assembly protein CpaB
VALGAGVGASWLIARSLARRSVAVVAVPVKKVAVAKMDMPLATTLRPDLIDIVQWPATSAPAGAFEDPAALEGRVVRNAMVAGEPLLESRLAPKGGGDGLSAVIPADMRAMTVRVNEASGVAGFIHPGDFVDVIATMAPRHDQMEVRSRIVLQKIRVVAVGEELVAQNAKPIKVPVVTLLVSPEESERLALASTHGELQLTMRSTVDGNAVDTPGVSPPDLYDEGKEDTVAMVEKRRSRPVVVSRPAPAPTPVATPAAKPEEEVVEIIRGSRSEERKLHSANGGR